MGLRRKAQIAEAEAHAPLHALVAPGHTHAPLWQVMPVPQSALVQQLPEGMHSPLHIFVPLPQGVPLLVDELLLDEVLPDELAPDELAPDELLVVLVVVVPPVPPLSIPKIALQPPAMIRVAHVHPEVIRSFVRSRSIGRW
jgi:hypothetical protein